MKIIGLILAIAGAVIVYAGITGKTLKELVNLE